MCILAATLSCHNSFPLCLFGQVLPASPRTKHNPYSQFCPVSADFFISVLNTRVWKLLLGILGLYFFTFFLFAGLWLLVSCVPALLPSQSHQCGNDSRSRGRTPMQRSAAQH